MLGAVTALPGNPHRRVPQNRRRAMSRMKLQRQNASAQEAQESALALPDKTQMSAVQDTPAASLVKVAFVTAEQEAQARERYAIISPLIIQFDADRSAPNGQLQLDLGLRLPDGSPVKTRTHMVLYLAHKHQLTHRTIWRWVDLFTKGGLIGLADSTRKDKDKSRFFERYPKAATLVA